jgi:hypothetical protein
MDSFVARDEASEESQPPQPAKADEGDRPPVTDAPLLSAFLPQALRESGQLTPSHDNHHAPAERREAGEAPGNYREVGTHVASVLASADNAAEQIRQEARQDAIRIHEDARQEAEEKQQQADAEASNIRVNAENDARSIVGVAERRARAIEKAARLRVAEIEEVSRRAEERLKKTLAIVRTLTGQLEDTLGVEEGDAVVTEDTEDPPEQTPKTRSARRAAS